MRRWLLLAVILTAPSGCDNVTWGGTEVHLQGPGEQPETASAPAAEDTAQTPRPGIPQAPILLAGTRDGDTVRLAVVGSVHGSAIEELPSLAQWPELYEGLARGPLAPGTSVTLFANGARVGRMVVSSNGRDDRFCAPHPTISGVAELVPGAAQAQRFLALVDSGAAASRPYTPYRPLDDDYDQRVASISLAGEAIQQVGAAWPTSVLESRADMQALRLPEASSSAFAATFLRNDRLTTAAPGQNAYAIFILGVPGAKGYQPGYTWYRPASEQGKGAPRYFDHLDWDGDGTSEILLDVFGAEHRWFAALAQRNGTWVRSFQDACGSASN